MKKLKKMTEQQSLTENLFDSRYEEILAICKRMCARTTHSAEDLMNDAFLKMHSMELEGNLDMDENPMGLIYTIIKRQLSNEKKRNRFSSLSPLEQDLEMAKADMMESNRYNNRDESMLRYQEMLSKLEQGIPDRQFEVLKLRSEGLRNKQIANMLGMSPENVRVTFKRAREKAKKILPYDKMPTWVSSI